MKLTHSIVDTNIRSHVRNYSIINIPRLLSFIIITIGFFTESIVIGDTIKTILIVYSCPIFCDYCVFNNFIFNEIFLFLGSPRFFWFLSEKL